MIKLKINEIIKMGDLIKGVVSKGVAQEVCSETFL